MAAPPSRRASPAALPDEIVEEILLRLPPDDPACLLRASLVCKTWSHALSSRGFRRRLHELHRTPPMLGFLHNWGYEHISSFVPTTSSSFSLAAPDRRSWRAIDCRHGRALFLSKGKGTKELLLWEPITGAQRRILVPAASNVQTVRCPSAAVFCAADGCDHRDCHGAPFHLVFVFSVEEDTDEDFSVSACVYSSETGTWGEQTSTTAEFSMLFTCYSSVLVGRSLFYFMSEDGRILEYDLARHGLTVFEAPVPQYFDHRFSLMVAEDGQLGVIEGFYSQFNLWSREASDGTDAKWVLRREIWFGDLRLIGTPVEYERSVLLLGFAEGANAIFMSTLDGVLMIDLESLRVRKVFDCRGYDHLIPVVNFYTPVSRDRHQDPPLSSPSEESGREDKTVALSKKGSGAIKEGGLVNTFECVSHDLEIRDPCFGEVPLGCASMEDKHGHALPSEAQEVTDPLGDVPNSALNEELVKGTSTTSKNDAGNSKTSGSNVEDAAPTSENGDS